MNKFLGLFFSLTLSSLAYASTELSTELPAAYKIQLKTQKIVEKIDTENGPVTTVKIVGTAFFPNECYIPKSIIKEIVSTAENLISYNILGLNDTIKSCLEIYRPIQKKILIHTFEIPSDEADLSHLPTVEINGKRIE